MSAHIAPALAQEDSASSETETNSSTSELTPEQQIALLRLLQTGEKAYNAGKFEDALSAYEKAYDIFPMPDILYRVALCLDKAEKLEAAREKYALYLMISPDSTRRGQAQARLDNINARIAASRRAKLELTIEPADAAVTLNGEPLTDRSLSIEDLEASRSLTFAAQADGHEPQELVVEVEGGRDYQFTISLAPLPKTVVVETVDRPSVTLFTGSAVAGAGALALLTVNVVSRRRVDEDFENCSNGDTREPCPIDPAQNPDTTVRDELNRRTRVANVYGIAAIGAGVTSAALFYVAWTRRRGDEQDAAFRVRPTPNAIPVIGRRG